MAGGEGLFNLSLMGQGTVALESPVPASEIVTVDLENDELKVDGNFAIAWTNGLQFTVERSTKTLIGSAASGEGLSTCTAVRVVCFLRRSPPIWLIRTRVPVRPDLA